MNKFEHFGIRIPRYQVGTEKNGIQPEYSRLSYLELLNLMKKEDPNAYNRLLMDVTKGNSPNSEIVRYVDAEGKPRTITNASAGYLSGTDPVGLFVVETAAASKPLQWIGKKIMGLAPTKLGNPEKYLDYHISRLRGRTPEILTPDEFAKKYWQQSGHPDLGQSVDDFIKELADYMRNEGPIALKVGNHIPVVIEKEGDKSISRLFNNKNLTPKQLRNLVISHEADHALNVPKYTDVFPEGFDFSNLSPSVREYFLEGLGTELRARGSQLKDFFGLVNKNQGITSKQLKYAKDNYRAKTGIDNQMTEFFDAIVDYNKAAKWVSKYASILSLPIVFNGQNNNN